MRGWYQRPLIEGLFGGVRNRVVEVLLSLILFRVRRTEPGIQTGTGLGAQRKEWSKGGPSGAVSRETSRLLCKTTGSEGTETTLSLGPTDSGLWYENW